MFLKWKVNFTFVLLFALLKVGYLEILFRSRLPLTWSRFLLYPKVRFIGNLIESKLFKYFKY